MKAIATEGLFNFINLEEYPLDNPESAKWSQTVARIQQDLKESGCSILPGFVRENALSLLQMEGVSVAHRAYRECETVNAYNIRIDSDLPENHPGRITFERGNAFVARDLIDDNAIIQVLFVNPSFKRLVADCFGMHEIYELADPLAGLCLNVLDPGRSHPWHFDKNEFTVSLLTQAPESGGVFEYCPDIRTPSDENTREVRRVLTGEGEDRIRQIVLRPGDLQFFKGRFSLHRVTPVEGQRERHTAIFAYSDKPGVVGYPERTRQLFGRVLPVHEEALRQAVRNDQLLD